MVAIVSGNALGLSLSSLATLGQRGASGSSMTGRNGEQAYVNAVTGNLVLQDRDELLMGRGVTAESLRTYNSRGLMTDDNGDNWSLGVYAQQLRLEVEGTYGQAGSAFLRTDRDGATARYTYDAANNRYVTTDGGGAHDTIRRGDDDRWVWTDGSTGREERYNWISGRLEQASEPNGAVLKYGYAGARLTSVSVNDREFTYYDYDGDLLQQIRTVTDEQGSARTTTRVRYGYDEQHRLASVTVDLTPLDTSDQATYVTTYAYEGDSKRISQVTQTDGTSLAFTYDSTGRVKTVTDALNSTTTFEYIGGSRTQVTGPMGLKTWYDYDPSGRLGRVTSLSGTKVLEVAQYYYNNAGDLSQTVDGAGRPVMFGYDERGNQTSQVDYSGSALSRTFDARNQLLTETLYTGLDPDFGGPKKPTGAMTTRYVYDAAGKNRLRFVLTPEGRVTEYIYDTLGQRTGMLVYTGARYPVGGLEATAVPGEAQMESWGFAQRTTQQLVRTDMAYDARGQLSSTTVFNAVSAVGEGVADGQQTVTQYVYDQQGLLRQTIAPGSRTSAYAYDGLGRLIASTDANNVTTLTTYDDALNQTRVRYDNGLTTISSYDRAGRLAFMQQVAGVVLGTTAYTYDSANRLRMTQDPTGRRQWMLYDAAGRKTADIDSDGSLTEYLYDGSGRIGKTVAYSRRVTTAVLDDLNLTIDMLRPAKTPAADLVSWTFYDIAGRVSKVVDGSGALTQTFYDGASRVTVVTRFANRVNTALLLDPPPAAAGALPPPLTEPVATPDPARDRTVRYFYDNDGRLTSELDGEGRVTEYTYDAAGRRTVTLRRGDTPAQDIRSVTLYNGQGRVAAEIDGENFLTEFAYDSNGNLATQVRYHPALTVRVEPGTPLASIRPAPSAGEQQVTTWEHDELNRVRRMTDPEGTVTSYEYDRMGRLLTTTRAAGTDEVRAINARYDLQGRLTGELSAEGGALLSGSLSTAQIEDIWRRYGLKHEYDKAGRLESTTDWRLDPNGEGRKTLYFYDADGRLERTINPLGEVEQRSYTGLNQLASIERYGPGTTDRSKTSFTYDNQGLLDSRTVVLDANTSATTSFDYNAFGGEELRITDLGQGARRTDRTDYDRRGLQTTVTQDLGGLAIKTTSHYDAFGRRDLFIDGNGQSHRQVFDRLGRVVATIDGLGKASSTSYDAFDRVLTQTDALLHTTVYSYDTVQRSVTVTTPENISVTTRHTRHGQTLSITDGERHTTRFEYDHDGNLLHTTTPLNSSHQEFDRAGRLTKTVDANGVEVTYEYDPADRLLHRHVDPTGLNLTTSYEYDGLGRQFKVTDPNKVVTLIGFDLAGRVLSQTVDPSGLNLKTVYTLDASGNTLTVQGPGGRFTQYVYDALGRRTEERVLADPSQPMLVTRYDHDGNGNVVGRTDANGHRTQFAYDANDRLLFTVDATGGTTRQEYDDAGRLVRTTRYAQPISLAGLPVPATAADILPRALAVRLPGQDSVDTRRYDNDGRLRFQVDGTGAVVEFKYDNNGNATERIAYAHGLTQDWDGSTDPAVVRDPARDLHTRTVYDALNRARFTADALGTVLERQYDDNGNLVKSVLHARQVTAEQRPDAVVNDPADRTEVFEYDKANRQTWHADAMGSVTRMDYDDDGNLQRLSRFAQPLAGEQKPSSLGEPGAADRVTRYTYDKAGRRTFAVDALNFVDAWDYHDDGTLRSHTRFGTPLPEGEIPARVRHDSAVDRSDYYDFDAAGRMLMHTDAAGQREHFTYDGLGNKSSFTDKNGYTWNYEYDAAGRLQRQRSPATDVTRTTGDDTSVLAFGGIDYGARITTFLQYDGRGLLTARTEAEGRPGEQRTTQFEYDAAGRQVTVIYPRVSVYDIAKDTPATGPEVVRIDDKDVALRSSTVYDALGNAVATVDAAGNVSFKVYDAAGRVIGEIDALGQVTQHLRNAFGEAEATIRYAVAAEALANARPDQTALADQAGAILAAHAGNSVDHGKDRVLGMRYDALGRVIEVKEPRVFNFDAKANVATISALGGTAGSIPGTTSSASKITTSEYDAFGDLRVTREQGDVGNTAPMQTTHYYDALGRRTATIDTMGYLTKRGYDAAGNLTSSTEFSNAVNPGEWDWNGYQAPAEDKAHDRHTSWTYDGLNRKRTETRHDLVFSDDTSGLDRTADAITEYRYDANGNLTQTIDALGATTTTFYDALGRVRGIAAPQRLVATGGPDATPATPLTLFLRDALGHVVVQVESARGGARLEDYVFTSDDRVTLSRFDALDHEVQRTDAENVNHFMSYNALGLLGKSWQLVRDAANTDQPALTLYKGFAYDRLGRVLHEYDPPPFTEEQHAGAGVIDTVHEYNAFGELTKKYTAGTPEAEREYFDYDNAGRLWRTNTGDGIDRIHLHDVLGRETALIVSKGVRNLRDLTQNLAIEDPDVRVTTTEYDALGRAVVQNLPRREVSQEGVTVRRELTWQTIKQSEKQVRVDVREVQELQWQGENEVQLNWASLEGFGAGDIKVQLDYLSASSEDFQGNVTAPVPKSITRIVASDQALAGTTLKWQNQAGISEVKALKVWKQDAKGEWCLISDLDTFGTNRNSITVDLPEDPEAKTHVLIRDNDTQDWRDVTTDSYNFGSRLWYSGAGLAPGSFQYKVTTTFPGGTEKTVAIGTLTVGSGPRLAELPAPSHFFENNLLSWRANAAQTFKYRRLNTQDWATLPWSSKEIGRQIYFSVRLDSLPAGQYEYELLETKDGTPVAHATGTFSTATYTGPHIGFTDRPNISDFQIDQYGRITWTYPFGPQDVYSGLGIIAVEFGDTFHQDEGIPYPPQGASNYLEIPGVLARPGRYEFRVAHVFRDSTASGAFHGVDIAVGIGVVDLPVLGPPKLIFATPSKVTDIQMGTDGRVSWPTRSDPSLKPIFEVSSISDYDWHPVPTTQSGDRSYAEFASYVDRYPNDDYGPQFRIRYVNADGITVALGSGGWSKSVFEYTAKSTTADHPTAISLGGGANGEYSLYQEFTLNGYKGLQQPHIEQTFDRWGNVLSTTDPRNATWKTEFAYNQNNQLVYQRRPNSDGGDTGGPVTQIYYDKLGRQLAVRDALNHINGVTYDAAGEVTSEIHADGGRVTHGYDIFGRRVKTTDAQANADADALLKKAQEFPGMADHLTEQANATRDAHTQRFTYDKLDRLTKVDHGKAYVYRSTGDVRDTEVLNDGHAVAITETFSYDEAGRQLSHINGNGELTQYRYDLGGHIVRTEQRGTLHQQDGLVTRYAFDVNGHKTLEINANGDRMGWTTDAFGRTQQHVDLGGATVTTVYDKAGQLSLQTNSRGQRQEFSYDSAGQLLAIKQKVAEADGTHGALFKTTSYTYDLAGNRVHERTEQAGVVAQDNYIGYDALGRMRYVFDGQAALELDYDLNGNRTMVKSSVRVLKKDGEDISQSEDELKTTQRYFAYDAMNRQTMVDGSGENTRGPKGHTITYDLNGNRLTDTYVSNRVKINEITTVVLAEEGRQEYTLTSYTFDVQKGVDITETYHYDVLNRLQSVIRDNVQVDFREYDGAGRVVRSGTPGGNSSSGTFEGLPPGYVAKINEDREVKDAIGLDKRINRYDAYGRLAYQNIFDGNSFNDIKQGVEYVEYDKAGNVKQYKLHSITDEGRDVVKTYQAELLGYEGYVQKTLSVAGGNEGGVTTSSYDLDGNLRKIEDGVTHALDRSFITDAQGRVLFARQGEHVQRELIVNGESLGNFGVGPDQADPRQPDNTPNFAPRADFSFGYQPISGNYPGPAPGVYTVRQGDSLQSIARQAYGDSKLWYRIAEANGLSGDQDLRVGQTLAIPAGVGTVHNDFETFRPYDPSRIVGDTTPSLPYFRNECGALSNIIGLVVTVVVSYFGGGAYAAMAGDAARQVSAAMLNGRFDWKDFAERTAKGAALDIAVGPGTGGYYMGRDKSHPPGFTEVEYDYKSTAIAGAAGFVGGQFTVAGNAFATAVVQSVASNVTAQTLNMAMGRQESFNWKSLVASAAASAAGYQFSESIGLIDASGQPTNLGTGARMAGQFATGLVRGVVSGAIAGRLDMSQVAIDAFGNALGNGIVDAMSPQNTAQEKFRQSEIGDQNTEAARYQGQGLFSGSSVRLGNSGSGRAWLGTGDNGDRFANDPSDLTDESINNLRANLGMKPPFDPYSVEPVLLAAAGGAAGMRPSKAQIAESASVREKVSRFFSDGWDSVFGKASGALAPNKYEDYDLGTREGLLNFVSDVAAAKKAGLTIEPDMAVTATQIAKSYLGVKGGNILAQVDRLSAGQLEGLYDKTVGAIESRIQRWEIARDLLVDASAIARVDAGVVAMIANFESGFDPAARPIARDPAKNTIRQFDGTMAMSSAYGYGQFTNETWLGSLRKYGGNYGLSNPAGITSDQANSYRTDLRLQAGMLAEFTRDNVALGRRLGGDSDLANVYALHNLGGRDGPRMLSAVVSNPDQAVNQVLSPAVIRGNGSLYGDGTITVRAAYDRMISAMRLGEAYGNEAHRLQLELKRK